MAHLATPPQPALAALNRAPAQLWLPRFSLSHCVRAVVSRSTVGLGRHWAPAQHHVAKTAQQLGAGVETGMMTINHLGLALPEVPFGGFKQSGIGREGGPEGLFPYLLVAASSSPSASQGNGGDRVLMVPVTVMRSRGAPRVTRAATDSSFCANSARKPGSKAA